MRKSQRFETQEKASVEVYGRAVNITADVRNISKTGACLENSSGYFDLDKGDLIRLTIFLNEVNREHNVSAEVVWRLGSRAGVAFIAPEQVIEKLSAKAL
jgi:hypothetical protein